MRGNDKLAALKRYASFSSDSTRTSEKGFGGGIYYEGDLQPSIVMQSTTNVQYFRTGSHTALSPMALKTVSRF